MIVDKKLKILVVDDHEFFRKGVLLALKRLDYATVVGEATDGRQAVQMAVEHKPDVVLMDIKMPGMDGIQATKELTEKDLKTKIVAFSMFGDEEYLESMIEAGAIGFILKNIKKDGLDHALQMIAQDKHFFSEELLPYFTRKYIDRNDHSKPVLSQRETEVLKLVAEGYSNQEIAGKLVISLHTVVNHRTHIKEKLGVKNTASLIAYAIRNKLINA